MQKRRRRAYGKSDEGLTRRRSAHHTSDERRKNDTCVEGLILKKIY